MHAFRGYIFALRIACDSALYLLVYGLWSELNVNEWWIIIISRYSPETPPSCAVWCWYFFLLIQCILLWLTAVYDRRRFAEAVDQ